MKIAQIAPLAERCPPRLYGGTERVVSHLTEELVELGHDVTLFASGDSHTRANLVSCCEIALRLNPDIGEALPYQMMLLEEVRRQADAFDILHFHIDYIHYPLASAFAGRMLTTLHGRLDLPDTTRFYPAFPDLPLVSISAAQRTPMPPVNWAGTVYHGLPVDLYRYHAKQKGDYLAFLGRISPEKRPDRAIAIAARAGMRLKMAAKIDRVNQEYWTDVIKPLVKTHPNVDYVGEINDAQKAEFLGNAHALLFPIDWPEPFGLVMIEAMACGTPVIAFSNGSVPEIIDDGVTGFVVNDIEEAIAAVGSVARLNRSEIRQVFEERFTAERMARDYVALYQRLTETGVNSGTVGAVPRGEQHRRRGLHAQPLPGKPPSNMEGRSGEGSSP